MKKILNRSTLIVGVDIDTHEQTFPKLDNTLVVRADITQPGLFGEFFDIAYSFATFEHVSDPRGGWQNMINLLRPGGVLWSVSSPLWFSPYGHHKAMLEGHPWAHLEQRDPESLLRYCIDQGIPSPDKIDLVHHVNYIYHPDPFNRLRASEYASAARYLAGVTLMVNDFDLIIPNKEDQIVIDRLLAKGFAIDDLLSQTHRLVAVKE